MGSLAWKVLGTGSAVLGGIVARKLTDGTWKFTTGNESPSNPEDPDVEWKEAVAFALLSGAVVGLTRMVASRQAAAIYKKSTGHLPKQVQEKNEK